jgi:hypothetical protein
LCSQLFLSYAITGKRLFHLACPDLEALGVPPNLVGTLHDKIQGVSTIPPLHGDGGTEERRDGGDGGDGGMEGRRDGWTDGRMEGWKGSRD